MRLSRLIQDIITGAVGLWIGLAVLWFLFKYAKMLPQPFGGIFAQGERLATPGGV